MTKQLCGAIALAMILSGCDAEKKTAEVAANDTATVEKRTCDSIRPEVIRVAATNGVHVVKIYDSKTIKEEANKISCSGRALVSSGQEALIYYRDFQDGDGDWLVQYSENQLDEAP